MGREGAVTGRGGHNDVRIQSQISNYLEILGHKDSRRTELPSGSRARWGFLNGSQGRHDDAEGSCHLLRLVHAGRTEPRALQDRTLGRQELLLPVPSTYKGGK